MEKEKLAKYAGIAIVSFLVIAGMFFVLTSDLLESNGETPEGEEQLEENETEEQEYSTEGTGEVTEESESEADVEISTGVSPTAPQVKPGEGVTFHNLNDFSVRLEFTVPGRTDDDFVIEPDGTLTLSFNSNDAYDVFNEETGDEIPGGRINVEA